MTASILVFDIGTSAAKAVLFDTGGRAVAEHTHAYETRNPAPGRQEQDPQDWWRAVVAVAGALGPVDDIAAVGLTGTMQNLIPLAADGTPLRPALLYGDARAGQAFDQLRPELDGGQAGQILGNAPDVLMSLFKLLWLRAEEPEVFAAARTVFTGAKDYIAYRLAGARATDPTQATTTGMMDLAGRDWSAPVLALAGIDPGILPRIQPADAIVGHITAAAAQETGLPVGCPVVNGCGDAGASTIGVGATEPGQVYCYLGASGWVARVATLTAGRAPLPVYTLAHPDTDKAIEIAAILSAGGSVGWLQEVLGAPDLAVLEKEAEAFDAAPTPLLFLPYLMGERNPFHDTAVRGAFLGLDRGHRPGALYHAVIEGVAFAIRHNLEALGAEPDELRLLGGGGRSRLWPQLVADAIGLPVQVAAIPAAATAYGAFTLAAQALGRATAPPATARTVSPRLPRRARADAQYRRFLAATNFARRLAGEPEPEGSSG